MMDVKSFQSTFRRPMPRELPSHIGRSTIMELGRTVGSCPIRHLWPTQVSSMSQWVQPGISSFVAAANHPLR
jgi:hypothetical protein